MTDDGIAAPEGLADEIPEGAGAEPGTEGNPPAEGKAGEAQEGAKDGGEKPGQSDGKQAGDWDLPAPEDFQLPDENLASFVAAAKKCGLTREQAAAMLDWHKGFHNETAQAWAQSQAAVVKGWREAMAKDPDFGGANFKATVAEARRALAEFDPDGEVRKLLRETGQQENPAVIRIVARVGRALGEHKFVGDNGGGKKASRPLHERMYPKMKTDWEG